MTIKTSVLEITKTQQLWVPSICPEKKHIADATAENIERANHRIQLLRTYLHTRGYGAIALPQVGINIRCLLAGKLWKGGTTETLLMLNPSYEGISDSEIVFCAEKCMNVGPLPVGIPRYTKCKVSFTTYVGAKAHRILIGPDALSMQHVIDHANGTYWGVPATNERSIA